VVAVRLTMDVAELELQTAHAIPFSASRASFASAMNVSN
jgi:hypothetical protein